MKESIKNKAALIIQLVLLVVIAVAGIIYIIGERPVDNMNRSNTRPHVKPFGAASDSSFFKPKGEDASDGDDVSLSGKEGRYDEALIGKKPKTP